MTRLTLLGAPSLSAGVVTPFGPERRFQLLAMLGLASGQWLARDEIAARFWPDRRNDEARRNLRKVIHRSRAVPGAAALEATDHALRWTVATDVQDFHAAVTEGRIGDALALRGGALMAGLDDADNEALSRWLADQRSRFDAAWRAAAMQLVRQAGGPAQRIAVALQMLELDGFDEEAAAIRIEAELQAGEPARARRSYDVFAARLMEQLGVEPSRTLRQLLPSTESAPRARPSGAAVAAAAASDDRFVGRRSELAELELMFARPECRLLTLSGPGGIGKSSLARRATSAAPSGRVTVPIWIDLQDLSSVDAAVVRLAQRLAIELDDRRDAIEQVLARLPDRALVVLDNAEHLADLAGFVERLLCGHPTLTLLVTSRKRLQLRDEWLLPLAGLATPDDESRDYEAAIAFDAVRLFAARATDAQRGFDLRQHIGSVVDIVDSVAGLPLAIELAAAWVRVLPPPEIARELRHSIDLLARDPARRDDPARPEHRSVRAVLERAWDLLVPAEREAMAALSVFRGGFTHAAAKAVADAALPVLSSLVDKSMLTPDGQGRFALHPLLHSFASERLRVDPDRDAALQRRHAAHFAQCLAAGDLAAAATVLTTEYADCVAAWQWAIRSQHVPSLAAMADPLGGFFEGGRLSEGIRLIEPALAATSSPSAERAHARVCVALAVLHRTRGDLQRALGLAVQGAAAARRGRDTAALQRCLTQVGGCTLAEGQVAHARQHFAQALALAERMGDRRRIAGAHHNLGVADKHLARYDHSLDHYRQALGIARELGLRRDEIRTLSSMGNVYMHRDEWAMAKRYQEEALELCRRQSLPAQAVYAQAELGLCCIELGALDEAETQLLAAQTLSRELEHGMLERVVEGRLAWLTALRGQHAAALVRLRSLTRAYADTDFHSDQFVAMLYYGDLLRLVGREADAQRVWRAVADDPHADSGVAARARRWAARLGRDADDAQPALTAAQVVAMLLARHDFESPPTGR